MEVTRQHAVVITVCYLLSLGCSEYTIIPARYAYLLKSNITDAQASVLERKIVVITQYLLMSYNLRGILD